MIDDNVLDKIRKMLRLAEHPNTGEHEASVAAEKATQLMLKYNIERFQVEEDGNESRVIDDPYVLGKDNWKRTLWGHVAKHNFCRIVLTGEKIHVIGRPENVAFVKELARWLTGQVEVIAYREVSNYGGNVHRRKWINSFCLGMTARLGERLKKMRQDAEQESETTRALVIHHSQELNQYMSVAYPKLGISKFHVKYAGDAYHRGRYMGDSVGMSPASRQVKE